MNARITRTKLRMGRIRNKVKPKSGGVTPRELEVLLKPDEEAKEPRARKGKKSR